MFNLMCVVVGEGTPFVVDIEADQFVGHLQDKIKAKKSNTNHCDSDKLELYLALKGNAWLSDVDPDLAGLSQDVEGNTVLPNYKSDEKKMLATRKLNEYIHDSNPPKGRQIHVLVVVPPESKKRKRQELGWLDFHDLSPIVHLENLPTVDNLRELLLQQLPFRLELTDSMLADRIFDMNSEQKESEVLQTPLNFMCRTFKSAPSAGASENVWQFYYDLFLRFTTDICQGYGLGITLVRNQADPTRSKTNLRPDSILTHCGLLLLRGEEKKGGSIDTPRTELTKKMHKWNPMFWGELPYILGYATSGPSFLLVAIDKLLVTHEIYLTTSIFTDRANMVKFFYNMAFLFKLMVNMSNRSQGSQVFIPYQPIKEGIRTIELLDTGFKRKYVNIDSTDNCRRLFKIYQTLESITKDIPERSCLQTVSRLLGDNSEFSVWLAPLGLERKPNNEDEVKNCLYCILTALKHWHSYDYCHGDIRWPNIVYVPGDRDYWILIDMDESYPNASKKIDWNHVSSDEILTFQHDLYQLGKLFDGFTCVPATMQQAIDECLNSRGSSTSATSLLDRYFPGQSE